MYEYTITFSHGIFQKAFKMEISHEPPVDKLQEIIVDFWKRENPTSHHPHKMLYPPTLTVYDKSQGKHRSVLKIHSYLH